MEADEEFAPVLTSIIGQHADQKAVLLRFAFVLGNLTTNSDAYRFQVEEATVHMYWVTEDD